MGTYKNRRGIEKIVDGYSRTSWYCATFLTSARFAFMNRFLVLLKISLAGERLLTNVALMPDMLMEDFYMIAKTFQGYTIFGTKLA